MADQIFNVVGGAIAVSLLAASPVVPEDWRPVIFGLSFNITILTILAVAEGSTYRTINITVSWVVAILLNMSAVHLNQNDVMGAGLFTWLLLPAIVFTVASGANKARSPPTPSVEHFLLMGVAAPILAHWLYGLYISL